MKKVKAVHSIQDFKVNRNIQALFSPSFGHSFSHSTTTCLAIVECQLNCNCRLFESTNCRYNHKFTSIVYSKFEETIPEENLLQ